MRILIEEKIRVNYSFGTLKVPQERAGETETATFAPALSVSKVEL